MAEYMNKEVFLSSMGLIGDETKYGNRDAEHQRRSYSNYMSYEILGGVEDSIVEEELEPVKHGRWISLTNCSNSGVYCSVCHKKVYKEDYAWCNRKNKLRSNYCPNCGAKMDGERRDDDRTRFAHAGTPNGK